MNRIVSVRDRLLELATKEGVKKGSLLANLCSDIIQLDSKLSELQVRQDIITEAVANLYAVVRDAGPPEKFEELMKIRIEEEEE